MNKFVLVKDIIPTVILDIRYYSNYNFIGNRIKGYEEPCAILTKEAAASLKSVSEELDKLGYYIKIFDVYRPQQAVDYFVKWSKDNNNQKMKNYFYPNIDKKDLFTKGYISNKSAHSRGSTIDLTLVDKNTNKEIDMGGTFDYFGEISHIDYKNITKEQYNNRILLHSIMTKYGFKPLNEEWWHFTLINEPYPNTYFNFPVNSKNIKY